MTIVEGIKGFVKSMVEPLVVIGGLFYLGICGHISQNLSYQFPLDHLTQTQSAIQKNFTEKEEDLGKLETKVKNGLLRESELIEYLPGRPVGPNDDHFGALHGVKEKAQAWYENKESLSRKAKDLDLKLELFFDETPLEAYESENLRDAQKKLRTTGRILGNQEFYKIQNQERVLREITDYKNYLKELRNQGYLNQLKRMDERVALEERSEKWAENGVAVGLAAPTLLVGFSGGIVYLANRRRKRSQ